MDPLLKDTGKAKTNILNLDAEEQAGAARPGVRGQQPCRVRSGHPFTLPPRVPFCAWKLEDTTSKLEESF